MDAFEPPKYLASLIAAVNDGAKSAQTGALAFTLVGLYLLATAFSTTDEDMLLQHTMPVSQIGVQVPVVFSFTIAPAVFLFLHVYTLIRYDMLAANLRQFRFDLHNSVPLEADRERCRQLLANVEFVQTRTALLSSTLYSRLYRFAAWSVLAGGPVATLIALQISSLRYQSEMVTRVQQVCIALDLMLLVWFFYRQRCLGELPGNTSHFRWARYLMLCLLPPIILILDVIYLKVPDADDQTVRAPDDHRGRPIWSEAYKQPLDLVLCPALHWGCRYLILDHRTLVKHVWNPQAMADLQADQGDVKKSLAAVEGVLLHLRNLRFANFDQSRLYNAAMVQADLSHATLKGTKLQGAILQAANMHRVKFYGQGTYPADLSRAYLYNANLCEADLSQANLSWAILMADLTGANLSDANLSDANLSTAVLLSANLSGATVTQHQLDHACGDAATKTPPGLKVGQCPSGLPIHPCNQ